MDPAATRHRRVTLPWRIAFVLYAITLTTGTHWPRLQLEAAGEPAPGKILHMLAFGGLTFLLWRTRWLGQGWRLLLVVLGWSLLDELSQGIPGLGRTVSWMDVASNWCGILIVFAGIRAIQPVGGPLNRLRLRMTEFVIDEIFTRWTTWLLAIAAGLGMGAMIGAAVTWIMLTANPDGAIYGAFISIPAGGLGGAYLVLDGLWRRERKRATEQHPCLFCGAPCSDVDVDDSGIGRCPACNRPIHLGQWQLRAELSRATLVRLSVRPMILAMLLTILAAIIYVAGVALYLRFPEQLQPFRRFDRLPIDLRLVFDMAILGSIAAVAVYQLRRNLARVIDQQSERCRRCGHDVHATGVEQGLGRCPECGTCFIRLDERAEAVLRGEVAQETRQDAAR